VLIFCARENTFPTQYKPKMPANSMKGIMVSEKAEEIDDNKGEMRAHIDIRLIKFDKTSSKPHNKIY
jgi:hypothetical protein